MKSLPECLTDATNALPERERWFSGLTSALSRRAQAAVRRRLQRARLDSCCYSSKSSESIVGILHLERRDATFIRIIKKDIEIARRVIEHSQQQRNLPTMMNTMTGRVLHQFSQWH